MNTYRNYILVLVASLLCSLTLAESQDLGLIQTQLFSRTDGNVPGLDGVQVVRVSNDGRHVYAASGRDGAVLAFNRDKKNGMLKFVDIYDAKHGVEGIRGASCLSISPDDRNLYATSLYDHSIVVFRRNQNTGRLSPEQVINDNGKDNNQLLGTAYVYGSADGANVYVAGYLADTLVVYKRNKKNGRLSQLEVLNTGEYRVGSPIGIVESPQGNQIYLLSSRDFSLAIFNRDTSTGKLTLQKVIREGEKRVRGLGAARAITLTPDGKHLYVVGAEGTIAIFNRHAKSGNLKFVAGYRDGRGGVDGVAGANGVTTSPNGDLVYIAAGGAEALSILRRDASTGLLEKPMLLRNGTNNIGGLVGARSVAVSPDGNNIYVASGGDNTLGVFKYSKPIHQ